MLKWLKRGSLLGKTFVHLLILFLGGGLKRKKAQRVFVKEATENKMPPVMAKKLSREIPSFTQLIPRK